MPQGGNNHTGLQTPAESQNLQRGVPDPPRMEVVDRQMLGNLFPERALVPDDTQVILDVVPAHLMEEPENHPLGAACAQVCQNEKNARFHLGANPPCPPFLKGGRGDFSRTTKSLKARNLLKVESTPSKISRGLHKKSGHKLGL